MDMTFKLQVFEGPLDLLLYLIEKNKVNIYDIPIVEITAQYMEYVNQMKKDNLDTLSEFLVMAATLLDIKSKMLLPKKEEEEQEQQHQVRAVEILQMELFQKTVEKRNALAERAAVGLRSAAVRRGRRRIPRRLPWGRLATRRRRAAWLLLRDAGVNALIVAQITIVHSYSSRVVRNTLARWMSLASCAARATLSRRLSRRKGCSA